MKLLRKNKWLEADSICVAQGSAVASNLMFETKQQHQYFFKLWNKYLGGMTEIIQYHLTPTTWTILFKTKSVLDIERAYHYQRKKSKKAKRVNTLNDTSRMLSEHMRIFLGQFVRQTNRDTGRRGSKVLHRFKKCVLKEYTDYKKFFKMLTKKAEIKTQIKKYQADESKYDTRGEMVEDSIWKVGNYFFKEIPNYLSNLEISSKKILCISKFSRYEYLVERVVFGIQILMPSNTVLRKYLTDPKFIKIYHPPPPN